MQLKGYDFKQQQSQKKVSLSNSTGAAETNIL
jgi:hypothetical protein